MHVAVLGTGVVGQTLATKLVSLGHAVTMGSRQAGNEKAAAWVASAGDLASAGSVADAASCGALVVHATSGLASLDALVAAGAPNLAGKVLVGRVMDLGDITAARGLECTCPRGAPREQAIST